MILKKSFSNICTSRANDIGNVVCIVEANVAVQTALNDHCMYWVHKITLAE